jgi:two-component system NtrC family sensor kinase
MQCRTGPLVTTIRERCRVCYTCVRECPAKAIRIADQQAEVMPERCIGCGNCVRLCSQKAKLVASDLGQVETLLDSDVRVAACLAPSFPAEFHEHDYQVLVGMIRALGFDLVTEVAAGADLVAAEYRRLRLQSKRPRYVATTCPAIVAYCERYHPDIVDMLAPIVSPMVAIARALRKLHDDELRVVFIGPCIAKKGEAAAESVDGEVDATITFIELRELLQRRGIDSSDSVPSDFDPPHPAGGTLFPISRGMLQAAKIDEDLVTGEVVSAEGRTEFPEAIREFADGDLDAELLEVLACSGCIMGPGMSTKAPLFSRRAHVSKYARDCFHCRDWSQIEKDVEELADLDLSRDYAPDDQRLRPPSEDEVRRILVRMGKHSAQDELNCGACGYETCREHAIAIYKGLAESEMCLPFMIEELGKTCAELTHSNDELASTQAALMHAEKLASMGQLAAGIAHEVNNPLGTVLMLSHILLDETEADSEVREDLQMIVSEADRCKKIVSGLLQFARKNKVKATAVDLRPMADQIVRTLGVGESISARVVQEHADVTAEIDRDQVLQVLTNLTNNAVAAMPRGGELTIRLGGNDERIWFRVEDTGVGIPAENRKKIFEPFFTTKRVGEGTGLGLSVTYGIVKMHYGDIKVESNADPERGPTGTTFTVELPRERVKPSAADSDDDGDDGAED